MNVKNRQKKKMKKQKKNVMIKELVMYQMKKVWELHNLCNLLNKVKEIIQKKSQSTKFMSFLGNF